MTAPMKFPSHLALIAALSAAPAAVHAQTATEQPADQTTQGMTQDQGVAPDATNEAQEQPEPVEGQIVMQSEDTILASNLMGSNIYSMEGESIGDVDDMIVNLDGTVDGIVIGVGGFLGIGKKSVAIEMSSLSVDQDENGNPRLETSATRTDLEAAETFVTKSEQMADERAKEMQQNSTTVNPTMTPSLGGESDQGVTQ